MKFKLIITADDYGLCTSVNQAIEACLMAGAMKSTCVMANMADYESAARLRDRFPEASLGLHWNLTQGTPVQSPAQVSTIVGPNGQFFDLRTLRQKLRARKINLDDIRAELLAQYERIQDLIGTPDFWNTHQNVHLSPSLFGPLVKLGLELGISAMRCNRRFTVSKTTSIFQHNLRHPAYWLRGQIINWFCQRAASQGACLPDAMVHLIHYGTGKASLEQALTRFGPTADGKTIECVIHPATAINPQLFGSLTESRLAEYQIFKDPDLKKRLRSAGIELVGFTDLYQNCR